MVQLLRFLDSNAGDMGSIFGQGAKMLRGMIKKKKKKAEKVNSAGREHCMFTFLWKKEKPKFALKFLDTFKLNIEK